MWALVPRRARSPACGRFCGNWDSTTLGGRRPGAATQSLTSSTGCSGQGARLRRQERLASVAALLSPLTAYGLTTKGLLGLLAPIFPRSPQRWERSQSWRLGRAAAEWTGSRTSRRPPRSLGRSEVANTLVALGADDGALKRLLVHPLHVILVLGQRLGCEFVALAAVA